MKKVLTLLFFITGVLLTACAPKYETVNGCEISPKTKCSKFALSEANLQGADLSEADLREADLLKANLNYADLREANLQGADLRRADLQGAIYNKLTKLPDGFDPEAVWMVLVE